MTRKATSSPPDAGRDQLDAGGDDGRDARKDYEQRRERQTQSIRKAKAAGKYKGQPLNEELHKRIKELLGASLGIRATAKHADCSTTTILRVKELSEAPHSTKGA